MSVEIAWKQNNLVIDFHLLELLQVVFGLGLQTFVCDFSRQNICSVGEQDKLIQRALMWLSGLSGLVAVQRKNRKKHEKCIFNADISLPIFFLFGPT